MRLRPGRAPQPSGRRVRLLPRPAARSLTAAATTVSRATEPGLRRLNQPWQVRALGYYDSVGECWYPAQFYARVLPKIRFFPALLDERGDPQEVDTGPLVDLWERVQDPGGGRSELAGAYGRLMFLTGDGYLTVTDDGDGEAWEYLSPVELRILPEGGGYQRLRAPGLTPEELMEAPDDAFEPVGDQARVWRLYRRHPAYSNWADSPVRAVLDLYELLKLLTLAAGAEAQSRAATRGLFYLPEELELPNLDSETGDEDPQTRELLQEIADAAMQNIRDPGSAAAMLPMFLTGPGMAIAADGKPIPMKDLIGHLPFGPEDSYRAVDAWEKAIRRISFGLDMPAEIVTGTGDVNHWGGWLLDEQGFRQHVAPIATRFADDLAAAYLRPAAQKDGIADWERVVIGYDPAEAVNHPDAISTAKDAHDRLVISDQAYRESAGYTDEDAPDEQELERRTLVKINQDPFAADTPEGETAPADGGTGGDTVEQPPPLEDAPGGNGRNGVSAQTAAATFKVMGAAELAVTRARSLAGSRIRNRSQGCEPCRNTIRDVPTYLVASALGPETVRGIITGHTTEADLVAGAGEELAQTIQQWGVASTWTVDIGRLVEQHALRTLYEQDPPPLPAGFAAVVAKALQ